MKKQIFRGMKQLALTKEAFIQIHVKPKPRWLPMFIWHKVLQRLLVMAEFRGV